MCASPLWESLPGNCEHIAAPSKPASDGTEYSFSVIAQWRFVLDIVFPSRARFSLLQFATTAEGFSPKLKCKAYQYGDRDQSARFFNFMIAAVVFKMSLT